MAQLRMTDIHVGTQLDQNGQRYTVVAVKPDVGSYDYRVKHDASGKEYDVFHSTFRYSGKAIA